MSDSRLPSNSSNPSLCEMDASCRLPLAVLFGGAALWLLVAAVAALLASMSFHKPDMFADKMWLSYGRILPFAKMTLLYGFCLPVGYGIALWLAARLGQAKLVHGFAAALGAKVWHMGVFIGAGGILCGAATGYEGFEMPVYAAMMVFVGSLLLGLAGLTTIHMRNQREMYPSLWFVITGLLWFPWILSTALLTLGVSPVRGVAQVAVQGWYLNNLQFVTLGLFGMGATLYFIPKLAGKGLYSRHLALFALLTLVLFGSWCGIPLGGPLPAWMGTLSAIAAVFALLPVLAHLDNLRRSCSMKAPAAEAKFFSFSIPLLVLAAVLAAIGAFVQKTHFTLFVPGQTTLLVQGAFALVAIGGIYHVLPKVAGLKSSSAGLIRLNLWLATAGVLLIALPYVVGGWQQGAKLDQAGIAFVDVAKAALMPIRMASLGETLWLLGSVVLAANVGVIVIQLVRGFIKPLVVETAPAVAASEVKA